MTPVSPDSTELLHRIRQQLILAQVRIMELEDQRDDLMAKMARLEKLQTDTQLLADNKTVQYHEMAATLVENTTELNTAREQLRALENDRDAHAKISSSRQQEIETLRKQLGSAVRMTNDLRHQLATLKQSRSWRWTAWLRKLGL